MDTQKITKQYRLSQWAKVIQARQDSGQTIKDFCQATGISENQYFYWQRKLRDMACTELALKEEVLDTAPDGWLQPTPASLLHNRSTGMDMRTKSWIPEKDSRVRMYSKEKREEHTTDLEGNQILLWTLTRTLESGICTERSLPHIR